MFEELHELLKDKKISKNELLAILKEKAKKISVFDLMEAHKYILQDVEFVQDKYQDDFRQAYVKQFIGHINNIKKGICIMFMMAWTLTRIRYSLFTV